MREEFEHLRSAEEAAIRERYARRPGDFLEGGVYHPVLADRLVYRHQKERVIGRFLRRRWFGRISKLRVLEVGCESGRTLQLLIGLGIDPSRTVGVDIIEAHIARARQALPASCALLQADFLGVDLSPACFDLVVQSTTFSSILNVQVRRAMARRLVSFVAPGGVILWYDLAYDNPKNPDVHGIGRTEIRRLFPDCRLEFHRMTLAPFIGRLAARAGYAACNALALLPFLRSHLLAWIEPVASYPAARSGR